MQNRKPHRKKAPQTGRSIFGTIFFSLYHSALLSSVLILFLGGFLPGSDKDKHRELSNSVRNVVPFSLVPMKF